MEKIIKFLKDIHDNHEINGSIRIKARNDEKFKMLAECSKHLEKEIIKLKKLMKNKK